MTQACLDRPWRDGLLLSGWYPDSRRRLQVKCAPAMLQRSGHRKRALGPTIHQEIQGQAHSRSVCRACHYQEAIEVIDTKRRHCQLPVEGDERRIQPAERSIDLEGPFCFVYHMPSIELGLGRAEWNDIHLVLTLHFQVHAWSQRPCSVCAILES